MEPSKELMQLVDEGNSIGVQEYLDYAFRETELYQIRCPCVKCCYTTLVTHETLESHLKVYGTVQNYTLGVSGNALDQNTRHSMPPSPSEDTISDSAISALIKNISDSATSARQGMQATNKRPLVLEKEQMQTDNLVSPSTDEVMQYIQPVETGSSITRKVKRVGGSNKCKEAAQKLKEQMKTDNLSDRPPITQTYSRKKKRHLAEELEVQNLQSPGSCITRKVKKVRSNKCKEVASPKAGQKLEEQMQTDIPSSPSTDEVLQYTEPVETTFSDNLHCGNAASCTTTKIKKVRGSSKCKEVASLEVGQKLKVTFYNNRTVGENSSIFSRYLGKLIRDHRMCPLGVSSWNDIEEEKLNNLWAAVEDKFEGNDMDIYRDHIIGWMKELWNKWRGQLHGKYVKGKPIQEALKNVPKGVHKKQWEWLVKEHFSAESFQTKSNRNTANRAKLKMHYRIGSKPIREIIYQKGGKDGNPPDLTTEAHMKDNKLVEPEAFEKYAQIQVSVQSKQSLPTTKIVKKCFGPQTRSRVCGFGGGLRAKGLKGGGSSKAKLVSELHSAQSLKGSLRQNARHIMPATPSKDTLSDSTISGAIQNISDSATSSSQGMQAATFLLEKEQIQTDVPLSPSTDEVRQFTKPVEKSSCTTTKIKKVRGSNKCKKVASLEVGEKLKVTFYNNRTVGENGSIFSRYLGKLIRDHRMCPLGVSSWNDIEEEKLNNLWAAVEDKFESDDMVIHRDHIMGWMKELWNKWRGQLHWKYVKGKPIEEALMNVPKGVHKKQWEWLVKEHFSTESFQVKSNINSANRTKLKMPHHIGSKPIREIIYQKGGKDGNPPDLTTVFFEIHKKDNKLVEPEAIEKHAQIQELVQSEPSLPSIEIVEKCFGPQTRSHVFGFGGGITAKDLKGAAPSKAEIVSALRSARQENQSLKDRLSAVESCQSGEKTKDLEVGTSSKADLVSELCSAREENQGLMDRLSAVENEVKELKQLKELLFAKHYTFQSQTSPDSGE